MAKMRAIMMARHAARSLADRFWPKVQIAGPDECWLWIGCKTPYGHGHFYVGKHAKPKMQIASRISLQLAGVEIPEGMVVDHICKVPACVNPAHLRVCLPRENYVDFSDSPMAANAKKTHCKQGHPFSPENIAIVKRKRHLSESGTWVGAMTARVCLTCFPTYWRHAVIPRPRPPGSRVKPGDYDYKPPQRGDGK